MSSRPVIAIDFGGVLSVHDRGGSEHFKTDLDMPGCIDALKLLSVNNDLVLVSFCGKSRAFETKQSIEQTIPGLFKRLIFVKDKKFKGKVCSVIGASFMIDDREEVLDHIVDPCVPVLFGSSNKNFTCLEDWSSFEILNTGKCLPTGDESTLTKLVYQL